MVEGRNPRCCSGVLRGEEEEGKRDKSSRCEEQQNRFFLVSSLPVALGGCPRMARAKRLASAVPEGRGYPVVRGTASFFPV